MGIFLNNPIEEKLNGIEFYLSNEEDFTSYLSVETNEHWQQLDKNEVAELIATLTDYYNLMR